MPELSGMEFAGMVSIYTTVIFTTSYPEYAIEAFEKEAVDYLLKPVSYERFLKAVNKVKRLVMARSQDTLPDYPYFYIKSDLKGKLVKVMIEDIIYIEASQNYVLIHCGSARHMAYLTMDEIGGRLPRKRFLRIHRSFIINTQRIRTLEHGQVTLDNSAVLPLGRTYKAPLLDSMKDLLIQSARNSGT